MKKLALAFAIIAASIGFGQRLPIPNPLMMDLPDSSFSSIVQIHGEDSFTLSGEYHNARILLSDIKNLTIKNFTAYDSDIRIAGCPGHTATNVFMRGGKWNVYPTAVRRENMGNKSSWTSATNFTWVGGSHSASFGGNGLQTIIIPKAQLKNGSDPTPYATAKWRLRDSTGKTFNATFWTWNDDGVNITVQVSPRGTMASGGGYWSCIDPAGFTKNIKYSGFDVSGQESFSIYFADGVSVKNSTFGPATLDYNLGFEDCANVNLQNVYAHGNQTVQGNGADVAFLYGIRGLKVRDCEIATLAIDSNGWEVSNVDSDNSLSILDDGWYGLVIEKGVVKRDALGVKK